MRSNKQTLDTRSKSGVSPTRSRRTMSATPTYQNQLDYSTKQMQIERRRFLEQQKAYETVAKEYEVERMLLKKLKLDQETTNIKSIPMKTRYLSSTIKSFTSNDNIRSQIANLKGQITQQRKEQSRFKAMTAKLNDSIRELEEKFADSEDRIASLKAANDEIKEEILKQKYLNKDDATNFNSGMMAISTTYYSERKQYQHQQQSKDSVYGVETNALPVLKLRLSRLIEQGFQKQRVCNQYKKVSQQIRKMFQIIYSYNGKQDVKLIVKEFVDKEQIISKLEQHASILENQLIIAQGLNSESIGTLPSVKSLEGDVQTSSLIQNIQQTCLKIEQRHKSRHYVVALLQKTLASLRGSNIPIQDPNYVQQEISSTSGAYIQQLLGQFQKYIRVLVPDFLPTPTRVQTSNEEETAVRREGKIDIQMMPNTDGDKQELLKYKDMLSIANQTLTKFREQPKDKARLSS